MTAASPANQPPKRRRPRSRDLAAAGEVFGDFTPWRNPSAVYAYVVSLFALLPAVGLVGGPIAIGLGVIGWLRQRRQPEIRGANFAGAGMILGGIGFAFSAAGVACLGRGLGWW